MKKTLVITVAALLVFSASRSYAAKKIENEEAPAISDQQFAAITATASESLSSRPWTVYWMMQGNENAPVITDLFIFSGNGVRSQYLTKLGFPGSNYSMHVREDQAAIWETVQFNPEQDMAMIRGELMGEDLTGTVTIKKNNGAVTMYSLFTTLPQAAPVKRIKK